MIWRFADFERILRESEPLIGNHDRAIASLRWGESQTKLIRKTLNSYVKRRFDREHPYFWFDTAGLKFLGDMRDRYAKGIALMPHYEDATVGYILQSLQGRKGAYFDIGTNMGVVASLVARATDRPVVAVEPDPDTARRAACTFAANGLRNVVLANAAIGDRCGEATFYVAPGSSDAASLVGETVESETIEVKVPMLTVDSLVQELGFNEVAFLKFDVEGFEPQAIAGAAETIRRFRPDMFFEYHHEIAPKLGWTAEQVRDQIEALAAYEYSVLHEDDPIRDFPPTPDMGLSVNVWCRAKA